MSAEPDNPMEKALRDYSRKRREEPGAPETPHGVTRRLLQAEVQRVYTAERPSNQQDNKHLAWWFRWQGLASLGTAVLALCLGMVWWASHESAPRMELALQDISRRELSEATGQRTGADKEFGQPPSNQPDSQPGLFTTSANPVVPPPPTDVTRPAAPPAPVLPVESMADAVAQKVQRTTDLAKSSVSSAPAALPEANQLAIASAKTDAPRTLSPPSATPLPLGLSQEARVLPPSQAASEPVSSLAANQQTLFFRQVNGNQPPAKNEGARAKSITKNPKSSPPSSAAVLTEFRLQHSNGQVTILDRDGSEYRGFLGTAVKTKPMSTADTLTVSGASAPQLATEASTYRFQVTGTNRSLQQKLVLEGQLRSVPIAQNAGSAQGAFQQLNRSALASQQNAGSLPEAFNWEIQSAVSVGTQQPVNLNAVQVPTNSPPAAAAPAPRSR